MNYHIFRECKVHIQNDTPNIEGVSTKQLYWHLVDNISLRPTIENKWNQKLDFIINEPMWQLIYTNYQKLITYMILIFQFKITQDTGVQL